MTSGSCCGPAIDPAAALDAQAMIVTSPSVSSRYPTTEPRLRAALAAVESEGHVPVVSEVDLFLRLCPAVTIGVTGTKGKTTTASLVAAVLEAGAHPVVLGGNIGRPLVEHLPALTATHRVVLELSELQLPTLSRGTDVAVYTHVTADHLDRHGTVAAYRAAKRRLAELADPDGALVLNAEDPVTAAYAGLGTAPITLYRRDVPLPGGVGVHDGWIVAAGVGRLPMAGGGVAATGPGGRVLPLDEIPLPGEHSVSNVLAAVAVGLLFGIAPDGIRRAVAQFPGVEHRLELVAEADGIRYVNDSQGTQPDAVMAALRSFATADRAHRRRPREGRRDRRAGCRRGRTRRGRRPDRRVRGRLPGRVRGRRCTASGDGATLEVAVERADLLAREALRGAEAAATGGPCDRPAQPGRRELRHVHRLRGPRPCLQGRRGGPSRAKEPPMSNPPIAVPAPRTRRPAAETPRPRVAGRPEARGRKLTVTLERERHAPDTTLLVSIVALTAIGILMVYSASGIRAYVLRDDGFADVGPQLIWALLGVAAMVVAMRIDYRFWRLASLPLFVVAMALLVLVLVPGIGIVIGGSARWLKLGPLPAIHPAEFAKLALIVYLAHWMASRGTRIGSVASGTLPVPAHRRTGHPARAQGAGPGHDRRPDPDRLHHLLRRRRQPLAVPAPRPRRHRRRRLRHPQSPLSAGEA